MKNMRLRNTIQLCLNLISLGAVIYGILTALLAIGINNIDTYRLFYLDGGFFTGFFIGICAFVNIILNIIRICKNKAIKFSFMYFWSFSTAVLSFCSIVFMGAYGYLHSLAPDCLKEFNFSNICLYFIAPALFSICFVFFSTEKDRKIGHIFGGQLLAVAFVLYSIIFASIEKMPDYYLIFNVKQFLPNQWYLILAIFIVLMIGPFLVGILFFAINNILSKKAIEIVEKDDPNKVEPIFETTSSEQEKEITIEKEPEIKEDILASKPKKKKVSSKKEEKKEDKKDEDDNNGPRVYHVSKRNDTNMWQVKFANGKKAIKFFKTQAEAMDYAKDLVKNNGGSIRVHSLKGKIRKAN